MDLNKWGVRSAVAALIFLGALACRAPDLFVAEATVTPTRTPRPTFTPLPPVTNTLAPIPTNPPPPPLPTAVPVPTKKPTARPVPTKVPTRPPAPPVQQPPTQPPASKMAYGANPPSCAHAGGTYMKGKVYDGISPDSGGVGGIKVGLGGSDGNNPWVTVASFDDGVYSFTLTEGGAKTGTYYIWLMDGNGARVSDIGGPIIINGLGPDDPKSCWAGSVDFWRR